MLQLPQVTLIAAETRVHGLARITLLECIKRVQFGEVVIYSNDAERIAVPGARYIQVNDWQKKEQAQEFYYTDAAQAAKTSHVLLIEWDAGINDPTMWSDDFLKYDYIGAPWGHGVGRSSQGLDVGNGGFSLWSKRFADFVFKERRSYPIRSDIDVSQKHRPGLERRGFRYAPKEIALRFSFEGWAHPGGYINPKVAPESFGFHGCFTWPVMLTPGDLYTRAKLVRANPFLVQSGKLALLSRWAPQLAKL